MLMVICFVSFDGLCLFLSFSAFILFSSSNKCASRLTHALRHTQTVHSLALGINQGCSGVLCNQNCVLKSYHPNSHLSVCIFKCLSSPIFAVLLLLVFSEVHLLFFSFFCIPVTYFSLHIKSHGTNIKPYCLKDFNTNILVLDFIMCSDNICCCICYCISSPKPSKHFY